MIRSYSKPAFKDSKQCRFCDSHRVKLIIDFGDVALAGSFLKPEEFPDEKKYPLQIYFCEDCYLLQIINRIAPEILFKDYFYFSSAIGTLRKHFREFAQNVTERFLVSDQATVVEIGCNDGVLLNPFTEIGIKNIIGIDPSTNVVQSIKDPHITVFNDFFTEKTAEKIFAEYGPTDMIIANNVFAHIDDMHDVTRGIVKLLSPNGVFIFEVHYLANLIEQIQYDMIYHEHLYYYSLIALDNLLDRFDLEIFDIKPIPIHAGSMRYYVRKKGGLKKEQISNRVIEKRQEELSKKYDHAETFMNYAQQVEKTKQTLMLLLKRLKTDGKVIYGYGASGRANTIIQYCGITNNILDCMIDDAPVKHSYYTPGSHFIIRSRQYINSRPPDYILVFAWSFIKEITINNIDYLQSGGKMIIPLPTVKIISMKNDQLIEEIVYN